MRSFLIIALIALVACEGYEKSVIDIVTCLLKSEKVREAVVNIVKAIKTKDLPTIISSLINAYLTAKDDVIQCFQYEPILTNKCSNKYYECTKGCRKIDVLGTCKKTCAKKHCN